jgi:hypothetical protein
VGWSAAGAAVGVATVTSARPLMKYADCFPLIANFASGSPFASHPPTGYCTLVS